MERLTTQDGSGNRSAPGVSHARHQGPTDGRGRRPPNGTGPYRRAVRFQQGLGARRRGTAVNVVVDPAQDDPNWARLGDGFRVELAIVLWEESSVWIVPTGALFRTGSDWHAFVVEDDRAVKCRVGVGRQNGLEAQVLSGLDDGDVVVLYPSELIQDGSRLDAR